MDVWVTSGDGGYAVREEGGRVAALSPGPELENAFFGGIDRIDGGDRMWMAPETEIFYDGPPDEENWRCPPELDPGDWRLERADGSIQLRQSALGCEMSRTVTPLSGWEHAGGLRWSGYRITSAVDATERRSAWHLVMLPAPADFYVRRPGEPIVYYPPAPPISDGHMRANGTPPRWKVGFRPPSDERVALAALYDSDPGALIVLVARLNPRGAYVDVPPNGGDAGALQAFNSPGDGFCELELHAPLETRTIESVVVAAWGSRTERLRVVDELTRD